mgnify:CR=1 FL=1|tara:strand:+ start:2695 stop:5691 length:2997 start_codon:yes stop_codon:yes gene_type:complete
MAIKTKQDPADLLSADAKSSIGDMQKTAINTPKKSDLVEVASLTGIVNKVVKEGAEGATKKKAKDPVVPKNVETVEEAITSVNKSKKILDEGDTTLKGFESSDDIISNLKTFSDDIETPINKVTTAESKAGANEEMGAILNMSKNWNKDNTLFSASQVVAAKQTLVNSSETLKKIALKINNGDDSSATLFLFREQVARHASLVQTYKQGRANVARALNAFKIPGDYVGSQANFEQLVVEELGGSTAARMMAETILDPKKSLADINDFASQTWGSKTVDSIMEIYMNGLLSSPRTQFRNTFGNAFYQAWKLPETLAAASINKLEEGIKFSGSKIPIIKNVNYFKTPAQGVAFEQFFARAYSYSYSWKKAFEAASVAVREGPSVDKLEISQYQKKTIAAETFGLDSNSSLGFGIDVLGKAIRMPGTALVWGDEFFKTMAKYSEEADLAVQHAMDLQKKGFDDEYIKEAVTDYIYTNPVALKKVDDAKKEMVFQEDLSTKLSSTQKLINDIRPELLGNFPVARVVMPFFKTPINIFKAVYDRSYGGVVKAGQLGFDTIYSTFTGKPYTNYGKKFTSDPQFRTMEMGKYSMSAGAFSYAYTLKQNGSLTGPPERDPRKRAYQMDVLGIQPHSFVFYGPNSDTSKPKFDDNGVPNGDLKYVSYLGIEPFGSFFGITANCIDLMENSDNTAFRDRMGMSCAVAGAMYFKEIPFLHGISSIYEMLGLSSYSEDQLVNFQKIIQQYSKTIAPFSGIARDVERIFDPQKRYIGPDYELDLEPFLRNDKGKIVFNDQGVGKPNPNYGYPKDPSMVTGAKTFANNVLGTYPIASSAFAPVYDYEFKPVDGSNGMKQGIGQRIYNAFIPFTYKQSAEIKPYQADIYRLNVPGYSTIKKYKGLDFSDSQWSMLNERAGQVLGTGINRNFTFTEALDSLYSGISGSSRAFLSKTGNTGSNDDLRRATLTDIRSQYLKIAFESLAAENEEFFNMQQAIEQRQEYLETNQLSRF